MLLLAGLSLGTTTTSFGLSQADTFRTEAESVDGLKTISASFPAGVVSPVVIMTTPEAADAVAETAKSVDGVSEVRPGERTAELAELNVVITAEPDTAESYQTIRDLRAAVVADDPDAVVGGAVAANLDARDTSVRDLKVISPLILAVVLLVLIILLRALVAPLVLILTVILSFFAALGAGSLLFTYVFDFPALDYQVPLLSFLFLVALGRGLQHLPGLPRPGGDRDPGHPRGDHRGPGRHRRGDHQRRHPAGRGVHRARRAAGDRADRDRRDRRRRASCWTPCWSAPSWSRPWSP